MAPTVAFSGRSAPDAGSFLAMGAAPAAGQQRAHGLRVRKQAEMMGITPGTSRLSQQTGAERWVSAPAANTRPVARQTQKANWSELYEDTEMPDAAAPEPAVPGHKRALANDEFYEGDPFADAGDDEHGQDVGEEDLLDEEYTGEYEEVALDDEYDEYQPEEEAQAPPAETMQTRLLRESIAPSRLIAKKEEGSKSTVAKPSPTAPRAALATWELFKVQKLNEVNLRDTGAKAICRIKNGLRQPGVQTDGRPFIPEDWDTIFKPVMGSFKKFILGRPDQFRIITGAEPGLFTIDIVSNQTVVAPVIDLKGKGKKGKGDDKGKGKGKDGKGGKSWDKSWGKDVKGKGKDVKGKGKGKNKTWSKEASTPWTEAKPWGAGPTPAAASAKKAPATRGASLLVAAAKEALAEEEEVRDEEMGEDEWPAEEDEEDAPGATIEDPIEQMFETAPDEEVPKAVEAPAPKTPKAKEEEEDIPAERPRQHGSMLSLLGGLLGGLGGKKRKI